MTTVIKTQFKNGVFQPLEKVHLSEGKEIEIYFTPEASTDKEFVRVGKRRFLEMLSRLKFTSDVTDASTNHDKYLYDNPHNL